MDIAKTRIGDTEILRVLAISYRSLRTPKNRSNPGFANPPKLEVARPGWKGDARIAKQCVFFANLAQGASDCVASAISDNQSSRPTTAERGIALLPGPRRYRGA